MVIIVLQTEDPQYLTNTYVASYCFRRTTFELWYSDEAEN